MTAAVEAAMAARIPLSLNQIETTVRKAVRGAGLSWGLADEAGRALRHLHAHGVDGAASLIALLDRQNYRDPSALAPATLGGVWRAPGGALDPLLAGACLADCAARLRDTPITTATITHPLLAAGYLIAVAENEGFEFTLTWGGGGGGSGADADGGAYFACRRGRVLISGAAQVLCTETAESLRCQHPAAAADDPRWQPPPTTAPSIDTATWTRLERYAHRTYVEATATSRITGAGAGLHDND